MTYITLATSEANVVACIEKIYPFIKEFASSRTSEQSLELNPILYEGGLRNRRRRRHPQHFDGRPITPENQFRSNAKRSRGQIQGTGFFNNAIHNSDEEDLDYEEDADEEEEDE